MINWFDMPAEGLSNGGLFEVKELEVTENGTYETKGEMYNKVTVNVEGGGGSSDFSTAIVTTINNIGNSYPTGLSEVLEDDEYYEGFPSSLYPLYAKGGTETHNCVLYKGHAVAILDFGNNISVSGNIEKIFDDDVVYLITGDCTITIS